MFRGTLFKEKERIMFAISPDRSNVVELTLFKGITVPMVFNKASDANNYIYQLGRTRKGNTPMRDKKGKLVNN